jgi:hypothetical protein
MSYDPELNDPGELLHEFGLNTAKKSYWFVAKLNLQRTKMTADANDDAARAR